MYCQNAMGDWLNWTPSQAPQSSWYKTLFSMEYEQLGHGKTFYHIITDPDKSH